MRCSQLYTSLGSREDAILISKYRLRGARIRAAAPDLIPPYAGAPEEHPFLGGLVRVDNNQQEGNDLRISHPTKEGLVAMAGRLKLPLAI
jgi:hypothetical protein